MTLEDLTLEDFMTTKQAAKYLKRTTSLICKLCLKGKLPGARRIGEKMWLIPRKSVEGYKPGLQGFAIEKDRKEKEKMSWLAEINAAIRKYGHPELATA